MAATELDVASLPIGLNGFVDGSTNLVLTNWMTQASFNSTSVTQTIFVPDFRLAAVVLPAAFSVHLVLAVTEIALSKIVRDARPALSFHETILPMSNQTADVAGSDNFPSSS